MFRGKGWFSSGLWKPKNPHSLEHLKYLNHLLYKNQNVTEQNKSLLVETLRSIAEILIWGDQNDSTVFDFFLEKNMLSFFLKIMKQKCGRYVCVQLLQTLNILFENIRNETSLYYLLSNNHVNSIIVHKFDFSDEEVMAYYISFLKTLSLKLNSHTIHFFYNEVSGPWTTFQNIQLNKKGLKHTNDFPLYTEAIKFFNHSESMVRIAVRTLTLNVFKVEDKAMLKFIRDKTAAPYFSNLVWFIGNHILELDICVGTEPDRQGQGRLADLVAEHLDHLHYLNDILCLRIHLLNDVLTDHLLNRLLVPLYVYSLTKRHRRRQFPQLENDENDADDEEGDEDDRPHVSSVVSLFLLSQVFIIISHQPLVEQLAHIILNRDMSVFSGTRHRHDSSSTKFETNSEPEFIPPEESLEKSLESTIRQRRLSETLSPCEDETNLPSSSSSSSILMNINPSSEQDVLETIVDSSEMIQDQIQDQILQETSKNEDDEKNYLKVTDKEVQAEVDVSTNFEDEGNNVTDEEKVKAQKSLNLTSIVKLQQEFSLTDRPFLEAVFNGLDCTENDHYALFSLCLLYALGHNPGINQDLLDIVLMPTDRSETKKLYNVNLVERLIKIIALSCQYNSRVRLATLQMSLLLLKQLVVKDGTSFLQDRHLAAIEQAREESTLLLRNFYKSEEIFLDMFEDEYQDMMKKPVNVEYLMMDANLLLPPTGTPMSGIGFDKRLPCGEVERARRTIRVFFLLRDLSLTLRDEPESQLPLTNLAHCIQTGDVLDHNNSDLLGCIVVTKDGIKVRRFMVIDILQLILVEPDPKRIGWGVTKFVGFLQDIEVTGDKDDSRCLHITVHRPAGAAAAHSYSSHNLSGAALNRMPLLTAKFVFDDNIRCMAAKQRLTKGRLKARQRKMHQIARLLDLPDHIQPCPSPIRHSLRPASSIAVSTSSNGEINNLALPRSHSQDAGLKGRSGSLTQASSAAGAVPHHSGHHHHYHHHHHHHGVYRPLFGSSNKVPGFATALRAGQQEQRTGNSPANPSSSSSSPSGNVASGGNQERNSNERHRRISVSPAPSRRRGNSGTRSREPSPRVRTTTNTSSSSGGGGGGSSSSGGGGASEEIPLEDMSKGRGGSRHNSPNLRRRSSSGLPQARICAPPYLPHLPISSPNIALNKRPTDEEDDEEEEEDVFQNEKTTKKNVVVRTKNSQLNSSSSPSSKKKSLNLHQCQSEDSDDGLNPKECTKPCCNRENPSGGGGGGSSSKQNEKDSKMNRHRPLQDSRVRPKTKGAIQTV